MEFWNRTVCSALAVCFGLALAGCAPAGSGAADDEKEPHYVLGQSRVNSMDFQGAVEAFEESLAANPRSAAAHFQLAMLYDEKEANPAAAIYHYQQYLRFEPKAGNAEVVAQRIYTCKQQLAADVLPLPSTPAVQQQLQQLADTNRFLQLQLEYYTRQLAAVKTNLPPPPNNFAPPSSTTIPARTAAANPRPSAARPRTHTVAANETPSSIARKYGVTLTALLAANPGLNPKKLRVGQSINLPSP
ncbi:MAG: LysM peptidoglycan-binding domain-containing protein [Verrucomicrobiales bacterium]|nr:LysM peptidoglycan-binding domain-containing protein [Verrucomicrobiales bacterium]